MSKSKKLSNVDLQYVEDHIKGERYFYDGLLTICVLSLKNGHKEVGTSFVYDETKYDAIEGMKRSKADAMNKLFSLIYFNLRSQ